jgi:hypothetical protein
MKTQAWGWLAAAVVAAALNASYHDGGLRWAHEIVDQVKHNSQAVLVLATGQADQFMAEAQLASVRPEASPCPFAAALAEARAMVMDQDPQVLVKDSDNAFDESHFAVMSARQEAALARLEARRARIEARVARIRIPEAAMRPVVVRLPEVSVCPRVRMHLQRIPAIKIPPMPQVHVDTGMGPI